MVRESRHLWVGNLPENVREEEIRDHFSSYGKVEKVKLLIKTSPDGAKAAFVDFVDIRSAVKANDAQNRMGERDLRTNFNEPGANKHKYHLHGYPPGMDYRQPVVIYAAAPPNPDFIPAYGRQVYQQNDRRFSTPQTYPYRPRGRSPSSRGYSSDERSPSPRRRGGYSSDSDNSSGKTYSVLVKNIGTRISDSSLEEALYHEFKKEGEIMNIKIGGSGSDRYAFVQFSSYDEAERACLHTGRSFHGDNLKVKMVRKDRKRDYNMDDLPFDPHSTRTIFVGNVEKTLMHGELKSIFEKFGDVVEVDIKKMQTGIVTYAFVQYIDINGSMAAKLKMDREYIGHTKIKVGFGRGTPTNSLWVGNLSKDVTESQLSKLFHQFGYVQRCLIDKYLWQALVRFETIESCTRAFADMHGKPFLGKRLAVDYASPACRDGFYSRMERKGLLDRRQLEPSPTPPDVHLNFTNVVRGGAFQPRGQITDVQPMSYTSVPAVSYPPKDYREERSYDRYSAEKPKTNFDYDKELRDYGYGRDRGRDKRDYSPMSRSSSSASRRRTLRDSISPVSSSDERRLKSKVEKRKKRKLSLDSPPQPFTHEPLSKKEKKRLKREKKEKMKKVMKTKGTLDFGYDYDEDGQYQEMKSKAEMKKEKKARKKAEKARKKAEKKQRKLERVKSVEEKVSNSEDTADKPEKENEDNITRNEENGENESSKHQTDMETSEREGKANSEDVNNQATESITENESESTNTGDNNLEVGEVVGSPEFPEPDKKEYIKQEKTPVPKKLATLKQDESSDSSSSSSSDSDESDDSSDDDDRDYKHRSYKERESMARKESERREPKAYRQDRDATLDRRDSVKNRDRSIEKSRIYNRDDTTERDFSRSRYSDRRSPVSYSGRRNKSPSSDRSRSPGFRRSRSRSPYSKRMDSPFDRRKGSPSRKEYAKKEATRSRRLSTPPPPPPLSESARKNEKSKYSSNSTSSSNTGGGGQSADTLLDLLRRFPVLWQGLLGLKNDTAAVQMHFLSGNLKLAEGSLPRSAQANEVPPTLRISQRMKLEPSQLDGVDKKIQQPKDHCMLLALPCGRDPLDVHAQTRALKTGFLTYLQQKQAAGIVNIAQDNKNFVVHIFPPCNFSQSHVAKVAPDLLDSAADSGHLMVLITPA